jgi:hypothetical protein
MKTFVTRHSARVVTVHSQFQTPFGADVMPQERMFSATFEPTKIGGKRMPLAATGIDFNRILLSA